MIIKQEREWNPIFFFTSIFTLLTTDVHIKALDNQQWRSRPLYSYSIVKYIIVYGVQREHIPKKRTQDIETRRWNMAAVSQTTR